MGVVQKWFWLEINVFFKKKLFFTELYNKKIDACKIKYKKNDKIERKKKKAIRCWYKTWKKYF